MTLMMLWDLQVDGNSKFFIRGCYCIVSRFSSDFEFTSLLPFPVELFYFHIPYPEKEKVIILESHFRAPRGAEPHVAPSVRTQLFTGFQLRIGYQNAKTPGRKTPLHLQPSGRTERMSTRN